MKRTLNLLIIKEKEVAANLHKYEKNRSTNISGVSIKYKALGYSSGQHR